MQGFFLGKTD